MSSPTRIAARLPQESVRFLDSMPGANRSEKLRNLIEQRGAVSVLLDEQKAMLEGVQKAVATLAQNRTSTAPLPAPSAAPQNGVWTAPEVAALYQALALISNAISKPGMAPEAANFCSSKVREIAARTR